MIEFEAPVALEIVLERTTNNSMSSDFAPAVEFEDLAANAQDAPNADCLALD